MHSRYPDYPPDRHFSPEDRDEGYPSTSLRDDRRRSFSPRQQQPLQYGNYPESYPHRRHQPKLHDDSPEIYSHSEDESERGPRNRRGRGEISPTDSESDDGRGGRGVGVGVGDGSDEGYE